MLLPSERASFCKPCFSSCRLAEDSGAANTQNYRLCMAENRGDFIASWALHVHEVGIGALHQALLLVFPLLLFWRGMKKILCERHVLVRRSSLEGVCASRIAGVSPSHYPVALGPQDLHVEHGAVCFVYHVPLVPPNLCQVDLI